MKVFKNFLISMSILLLFLACRARGEVKGEAHIYLTVLDENGSPLKDSDASYFFVSFKGENGNVVEMKKLVLNENDDLIYNAGYFTISYNDYKRLKKKDEFSNDEVMKALKKRGCFSIKDKRNAPIYKEEKDISYFAVLDSCERTTALIPSWGHDPMYICHCKIRLQKN